MNAEAKPPATESEPAADAFRNNLGTADKEGRRVFVYPRQPHGRFYRWRTILSVFQLAFLFAAPFIHIGGQPLLMFNILERKFVIFGKVFWPQDFFLFAIGMLCLLVFIVLFTAIYGRVFCGWLCPHSIFLEMLFRKIEYLIDGDGPRQQALAKEPWGVRKLVKRLLKHGLFFAIAFAIGNVLLAYIVGSKELLRIITDDPRQHLVGLAAMLIFTGLFYWIYAYFREQICCFVCPYGRLQSVMLDEGSLVVAYDPNRGEPRGRFQRGDNREVRTARQTGDCIDCGMCFRVCPTGIDIRNGTQLECINCAACIDACDFMMDKVGLPRGLVRYASQNGIERGDSFHVTPRVIIYTVVLAALIGVMTFLVISRQDVDVSLLRKRGQLPFRVAESGEVGNIYNLSVANKSTHETTLSFKLESPAEGQARLGDGNVLAAAPECVTEHAMVVLIPQSRLKSHGNRVRIGVYRDGRRIETLTTTFATP